MIDLEEQEFKNLVLIFLKSQAAIFCQYRPFSLLYVTQHRDHR